MSQVETEITQAEPQASELEFNEAEVISRIQAAHDEALARQELLGEEAPPKVEEPTADKTAETEPISEQAAAKEEAAKEDKGISLRAKKLQLLAKKEASLREREEALKGQALTEEEVIRRLLQDPKALLSKYNQTPEQLATVLWGKALGEDAPAEFREKSEAIAEKARVDELQRQLEQAREEAKNASAIAAQTARVEIYDDSLKRFAQKGIGEDLHFLKTVAKDDWNEAYEAIATYVSGFMLDADGHITPSHEWPTVEEAARAVNDGLRKDWERFNRQESTTATERSTQVESTTRQPLQALSGAEIQSRPVRQAEDRSGYSDDDWEALALRTLRGAMRSPG